MQLSAGCGQQAQYAAVNRYRIIPQAFRLCPLLSAGLTY